MAGQGETSDADIIGDNVAGDLPGAVRDLELLAGVSERRGALSAEEGVVSLGTAISVWVTSRTTDV